MNRFLLARRIIPRAVYRRPTMIQTTALSPSYHLQSGRFPYSTFFAHEWHHQGFMKNESLETKQGWLSDLIQKYPAEVDAEAYSVVLQAIATSSHPGAPQQAEELINRMAASVEANDACYQAVLEAWANSRREDSSLVVVRAERWFSKIRKPTLESYHLFLHVATKGRIKVNNRTRAKQLANEYALKAEEILRSMATTDGGDVQPDTKAYNYVIRGWSRLRRDPELMAEKVMEWLTRMEQIQQENPAGSVQPNTQSYAMGMESYALLAGHRAKWKAEGGLEELAQVESLLNYMQDLHKAGYPNVVPNTVAHNILLSAYARLSEHNHADAPLKAEKLLRRMQAIGKDAEPDHISFTKIILAWTNANRPTSGQRAGYWLDKLWELYEEKGHDDRLRPTIGTYNLVIKAWKHDPENVEKVFMQLLRAEKAEGEAHLRPNTESFSHLIISWSKHDLSRAVMWLEELMRREASSATGPSSITTTPELYKVLLRRSALDPSLDNLSLSLKVFEYLQSSRHVVDIQAYASLLKVGLRALAESQYDADRRSFVADVIQDCCNDGLMSNVFVRELANAPSYHDGWTAEESRATLTEHFSEWPIPASWTRNVQEKFNIPQESDTVRTNCSVFHHRLGQEEQPLLDAAEDNASTEDAVTDRVELTKEGKALL